MRRRDRHYLVAAMVCGLIIALGVLVGARGAAAQDMPLLYCSQEPLNGVVFCFDKRSMFYLCTTEALPRCMPIAPPIPVEMEEDA